MGSPKSQTNTTQVVLSPEQRQMLNLAMPGVREFAKMPLEQYPGSQVAPFTPEQTAGQESALAAAPTQQSIAGNAASASNRILGADFWRPENNPALQGAIDASTRPIMENYQETIAPAIRGGAISAGQLGGSRQGVAEGMAAREAMRAVGDTASKLVQNQYQTNVDAQLKALGLAPTVQQAQLAPGITQSGVGDVRQAMNQALLSEDVNRFNFDRYAPFMRSQEIIKLMGATPGGGSTSTATGGGSSPFQQAAGGMATGASMGSMFGPFGTMAGAGMGAVLPFLF